MAIKLSQNSSDLLAKKFANAPRGYDALDEYLDLIIRDYKVVESNCLVTQKELDNLKEQINELQNQNKEIELELAKYKARLADIKENDNVSLDNIDLVRRINVLEKFLYQHGFNPNTIK